MLKNISSFLYKRTNWKLLLLSIALMIFFFAFVLPRESERARPFTQSASSPDTSLFYTSSALYEIADAYGEEGISYYIRSKYSFDIAWPLVYMFFLLSSLTIVFRSLALADNLRSLNLLPVAAMIFDFIENTLVSIVFTRYPALTPVIAELAPFFTLFKWILIAISFLLLGAGLIWLSIRKISSRMQDS